MLQMLINYYKVIYFKIILTMFVPIHIRYSPTYPSMESADMHHYIDNGINNTVCESCYSAHQALSRFSELHIDMVS